MVRKVLSKGRKNTKYKRYYKRRTKHKRTKRVNSKRKNTSKRKSIGGYRTII